MLINGRPLAVRWIAEHVPAVIEAWNPGEKGGQAVAEITFRGRQSERQTDGHRSRGMPDNCRCTTTIPNPSVTGSSRDGGCPMSISIQSPCTRSAMGLSYTRFTYGDLQLGNEGNSPGRQS